MSLIPTLSVVVLTHNTRELVLQCLACFCPDAQRRGWQVVVVDNASTDHSAEAIRARFPDVELVRSEQNLGYAGGNNLGLQRAHGEVVILLNSDVLADAPVLHALAVTLWNAPDVGAISPRLLTAEGSPQAFAFGGEPDLRYLLRRGLRALLRLGPLHRWDIAHTVDVDWVSGACLCLRRSALQGVGPLDERFFLYFEDVDLCVRLRRAGWRVVYDPRHSVVHLGGSSRHHGPRDLAYYRSLSSFHAKHYGPVSAALVRLLWLPYIWLRKLFDRG